MFDFLFKRLGYVGGSIFTVATTLFFQQLLIAIFFLVNAKVTEPYMVHVYIYQPIYICMYTKRERGRERESPNLSCPCTDTNAHVMQQCHVYRCMYCVLYRMKSFISLKLKSKLNQNFSNQPHFLPPPHPHLDTHTHIHIHPHPLPYVV